MTSSKSVPTLVTEFEVMMKQKDGTSKFVALFLLLDILSRDTDAADKCWASLDPGFLDKLILASTYKMARSKDCLAHISERSKGTTQDEAHDLQGLGIAILRAYMNHDRIVDSPSYFKRCDALMKAYISGYVFAIESDLCSLIRIDAEETIDSLGQILQVMTTTKDGAITMISSPIFKDFAETIIKNEWADGIAILSTTSIHAIMAESTTADLFHDLISNIVAGVIAALDNEKASFRHLLRYLRAVTSAIASDRLRIYMKDDDISRIRSAILKELSSPARSKDLSDVFILIASLMRYQGHTFILRNEKDSEDQQSLLLISSLCATEIRSSLAGLVAPNADMETQLAKLKVASCFDIVRIICLYLVTIDTLALKADDILKIRDNFSAAFGETISYLRDRWDTSPLCPNYAMHTNNARLKQLGADAELLQDPSIISGSQSLALWLQEDASAHNDANGIMDVLLGLIKECKWDQLDYGSWLIPAISALIDSEKGLAQFSYFKGSRVLLDRLDRLADMTKSDQFDFSIALSEAQTELGILRIAAPQAASKWESTHQGLTIRIEQAG